MRELNSLWLLLVVALASCVATTALLLLLLLPRPCIQQAKGREALGPDQPNCVVSSSAHNLGQITDLVLRSTDLVLRSTNLVLR